jgi:hypothetical protein
MSETEAMESVIESHQLAPHAFNKGNCLRVIFDKSVEKQDNATDEYYAELEEAREDRKRKRDPEIDDKRHKIPRRFYPKIVKLYEVWKERRVKMTAPRLQRWLQGQNFDVHLHTCRRLIHDVLKLPEWGKYDKTKRDWKDRADQKRQCVIKYAYLEKCEQKGEIIKVYWDESYIHQNHDVGYEYGTEQHGSGRGERLILGHAMTKDGLVCGRRDNPIQKLPMRQPVKGEHGEVAFPTGVTPLTAEWVWKASSIVKDYHKNQNGDTCSYWFQQQIIPAVEAMYPVEKRPELVGFVHVIDNAPYHWEAAEGCIPVNTITKKQMDESGMPAPPIEPNLSPAELKKRRNHGSKYNLEEGKGLLTSLGIESINIDRPHAEADFHPVHRPNDRKKARKVMQCTIPKKRFFVNSGGPLVEELRSELKKAIMLNRPEIMMSKFEKICNDTLVFLFAKLGITMYSFMRVCLLWQAEFEAGNRKRWHACYFTVPYWADSQPPELIWQMTKGRVGTVWYPGRTLKATLQQWHVALYGGELSVGLDPEVRMPAAEEAGEDDFGLSVVWDPVDAAQCAKFVRKTHRHLDEFIDNDSVLTGDLKTLGEESKFESALECIQSCSRKAAFELELQDDGGDEDDGSEEGGPAAVSCTSSNLTPDV